MMTESQRIEAFLKQLDSQHTRRAYQSDLGQFLEWLRTDSSKELVDVQSEELQDYLRSLESEELALSTRRRRLSAVRRFYDWMVENDIIDQNPGRSASITLEGRESSTDARFLTKQDLESVIRAADSSGRSGTRDEALVRTIVYGALRRSEVAVLNIEHVRPLGRHWVIDLPRDGNVRGGFVKIPDSVVDALQRLIDTYDEDTGPLWRSFSNRNRGERMSPDALYKCVRRIGARADIDGLNIETLRRSGLQLAAKAGARPAQLQSHARLQSPLSTIRYFELEPEEARLQHAAGDYLELDVETRESTD